jgi:UDP-3-O-[3-hydroxymyristoyl] glucosamine N-acyltransferase
MILLENLIARFGNTTVVGNHYHGFTRLVQASSNDFDTTTLTWVSDKHLDLLYTINNGFVICSKQANTASFKSSCTYLVVANPRNFFSKIIQTYFNESETPEISAHSSIDSSCSIGNNVHIKAGVRIEKNCSIGDNTFIDFNTVIKRDSKIGANVKIGANNTIGGVGFGYEKNEQNEYELIPHIGNVVIEDFVEIGNNTTVDRAVLGSTILRKNCKIDNLVHIAHGVIVGENSLVIANAMVAGSVTIGKNVWVAPSSSILNKTNVGDGATIGMGAVVLREVESDQTIVGNPGKPLVKKNKSS